MLHIPEGWAGTWTAGLSLGAAAGKWAISPAGSTQQEWESHSSQSAFTWNADLKCPYFLHNTILSNSSILKTQLVRKENGRSLINTAILIFFWNREIQNKFTCWISFLPACILPFSCGCADTLQSVSLMNIDSSSRWGVAYLHPLHLCVKFITRLCYTERLLEGGQNTWKPEQSQPDEYHMQVRTVESLFSPRQSKTRHAASGWEEVEICKERCWARSHHLLQQQLWLWLQQLGYLDLAIAPKTGRGTPAGAQVKILWQGILASVRRLLALLPAKMNANVNGRQRRLLQSVVARALPAQWSSWVTSPIWAWLLSTPGEKIAGKHHEKAKQKSGQV